jgi:hypothetical protein
MPAAPVARSTSRGRHARNETLEGWKNSDARANIAKDGDRKTSRGNERYG